MTVEDNKTAVSQGSPNPKEVATTNESATSADEKIPDNPWQAAIQIIWKWKPRWRNSALVLAGIVFLLYLVWATLPEKVKTDLFTRGVAEPDKPLNANIKTVPAPSDREVSYRASPITFLEFYETYFRLGDRFLERDEFCRNLTDAKINWVGYVDSVSAMGSNQLALFIRTSNKARHPGEELLQALVRFDSTWQTKLYSFRKLDKVRVVGILKEASTTPVIDGLDVTLVD
jgi:hypothetical protein